MRLLLSSCKRMQSHKPEEEGIHLDCCLSSIFERLCRHIFALWMCALRLMSETMVTSQTGDPEIVWEDSDFDALYVLA